jgi:hypothetical protein
MYVQGEVHAVGGIGDVSFLLGSLEAPSGFAAQVSTKAQHEKKGYAQRLLLVRVRSSHCCSLAHALGRKLWRSWRARRWT